MLVLNAADTIRGVASVATQITCTIMGMELAAGVETYDILYQGQLSNSAGTLYTAPASTQSFIKSIHVVNNDSAARTFQLFANGTAAANAITPAIQLGIGGFAVYGEHGWRIFAATGEINATTSSLLRVTNILTGTTTWTPGAGTRFAYIEAVGGGAGGGGVATAATNSGAAGGGGSGAFSALFLTVSKASYACVVGGGGNGGTAGNNNGSVGSDTTFDSPSILTAKGGSGGIADTIAVIHAGGLGGAGGLASGGVGDILANGGAGLPGLALAAAQAVSGKGGDSHFGSGANALKTQSAGANAVVYGGGGSGGCALSGGASVAGGNGSAGLLRIWEFS